MRHLKITIATRDGEVLDTQNIEVEHDVRVLVVLQIHPSTATTSSVAELEIGLLGTTEL